MASSRSAQPSAAFLLKCAKEKEKLRNRLQKSHQKHVLQIFEDIVFPDLCIKTLDGKEVKTHSAILKIRVPTFYNHLVQSNAILPLSKLQIESFLRQVYTNDDIRKHECSILRQQREAGDLNSRLNVDENSNTMCDSLAYGSSPSDKKNVPTHLVIPESAGPNQCDDSPMSTSSMVRSGTFDLQTPQALEKALDDGKVQVDVERVVPKNESYKEMMANTTKTIQQCMTANDSDMSFFLHHQHSTTEKKTVCPIDVNMSDSGFLSQSLVSESSSVASSLLASWEGNSGSQQNYPEKDRTSPMFPHYIDVDKWGVDGNDQTTHLQHNGSKLSEPVGVNPSKTLDLIAELPRESGRAPTTNIQRPKSCYMFIDFDSVKMEAEKPKEHKRKQSLSMFIDFNNDISEPACIKESQPEQVVNALERIPDLIQSQSSTKPESGETECKKQLISSQNEYPGSTNVTKNLLPDEVFNSPRKTADVKAQIDEACLLPMSPILRRKAVKKEVCNPQVVEVLVKASTKPQDVDALKFRRSVSDDVSSNVATSDATEVVPQINENKINVALEPTSTVNQVMPNGEQIHVPESTHETSEISRGLHQHQIQQASYPDVEDDTETVYSEVSDISSSVLVGFAKPTPECHVSDGEEHPRKSNLLETLEACSKLGEDLLRMFLEEISPDVIIYVEEKEIKAHKCILISRCKYFAVMLDGDWLESSGNTIHLEGFSYPVVHFALCHLYSGAISLPHGVNISELALLADVWTLDTLKDVIVFYLKMNYCHFFHKPCAHCIVGVVECLPIAEACNLSDMHCKAVKWVGRYFTRVWPTKSFAALPDDMREQCYQHTIYNLSVDTVVDMTLSCDKLMATLPHVKWAEPVFGLVTRLLEDCIHFLAGQFDQVLASDSFMALGKSQSWNVTALEDSVLSAVELVSPDTACRMFIQLGRVIPATESESAREMGKWTQNFLDLLHRVQRHCERYLIHNANRVVHSQSWALLAPEVQKKIKDAAIIVFEFEKPTAPPPRLSSLQRKQKRAEDKSLTFPRKAQVVRGKKTSKSFRERSADKMLGDEGMPRTPERLGTRSTADITDQLDYSDDCSSPHCTTPLPGDRKELEGTVVGVGEDDTCEEESFVIEKQLAVNGDLHKESADEDNKVIPPKNRFEDDQCETEIFVERKRHEKLLADKRKNSEGSVCLERKDSPMSADSLQNYPLASPSKEEDPRKVNRTFSPTCSVRSCSQVAMVSPFSVKASPTEDQDYLVAEIDEETMLVNSCLQEAEILEQALARKLHKQTHRQVAPETARPLAALKFGEGSRQRNAAESRIAGSRIVKRAEPSKEVRPKKILPKQEPRLNRDDGSIPEGARNVRGLCMPPRAKPVSGRTKSVSGSSVSKK